MEVAAHSPDDTSQPALHDTGVGPRRQAAEHVSSPIDSGCAEVRERHASSSPLLERAREAAVELVQLSPPLGEAPTRDAAAAAVRPAGGVAGPIGAPVAAGAGGGSAASVGRPVAVEPPAAGDRDSLLPGGSAAAPRPLTAVASEESRGQRERAVSERSPVLPSGERCGGPVEPGSAAGGAEGGASSPEVQTGGRGGGGRGGDWRRTFG